MNPFQDSKSSDRLSLPPLIYAGLLLLVGWLLWAAFYHQARRATSAIPAYARPNPALTPGDILTTDTKLICAPGYTKTVRNVPEPIKRQVYREYGIARHPPGEYEVDHLISLELGGSNSVRNLWPQSYITQPLNAHVKDRLENKLHDLICSGSLPDQAAQQAIAKDWVEAYQKYVGPLPR